MPSLDDGADAPCSDFDVKMPAGIYHIIVSHYSDSEALSYLVNTTITPLIVEGGMCEVPTAGEVDNCAIDTTCRAADGGDSTCVRDGCGNGFVEELEGCDDGNLVDADGCSSICFDEALCGNDVLNTGEECDEMASDCVGCTVQALDVSAYLMGVSEMVPSTVLRSR